MRIGTTRDSGQASTVLLASRSPVFNDRLIPGSMNVPEQKRNKVHRCAAVLQLSKGLQGSATIHSWQTAHLHKNN
ncbi:unnamed protein product [Ixodes pacificus]